MPSSNVPPSHPRHLVTAVLVAHDGERWLPHALAALSAQRRPPQRLVAVDTGSVDGSAELLTAALGPSSVRTADPSTGFGAAVQLGLDAFAGAPPPPAPPPSPDEPGGEPVEWVWLLHDDCAPEPDALERLLAVADATASVAVVGPKVRDWYRPQVLLEVGITTDRAGHRHTGLDRREVDQGQHDDIGDVLAVGSAGALVRRDAWDELGGYDRRLPLFRDDLDFGWRASRAGHRVLVATDAVVLHAQAGHRGLRPLAATADRPHRVDRRHALYTVLTNGPAALAAWRLVALAADTVLRALVALLARRPRYALEEVAAYLGLLRRLPAVLAGRRARAQAGTATVGNRSLRHLFPRRGARVRTLLDGLGAPLRPAAAAPGRHQGSAAGRWRRIAARPGVQLAVALGLIAAVAERHLIGAGGLLLGGRLAPAPGGASDLWRTYLSSWHDAGAGSTSAAPAYLGALAVLSTVLLGKAWLAVDLLLLAVVPLAGISAHLALRHLRAGPPLRAWAAATYALLPVGTGALSGGRLGVAVGFVLLPQVVAAVARAGDDAWHGRGLRRAWLAGLSLAVAAAFAPELYPIALAAAAGATLAALASAAMVAAGRGALVGSRASVTALLWGAGRLAAAGTVLLAVPAALLVPWTFAVWHRPAPLALGIGGPARSLAAPRPYELLLAHPAGPGTPPAWALAGLLAAALAVTVRRDRPRVVALAPWGLVAAGWVAGLVVARTAVTPDAGGPPETGWPGAAAAVVGAGLVVAAVLAARGARGWLSGKSFSWHQPVAAVLAVAAGAAPLVLAGGWLVRGTPGPLHRMPAGQVLPAFVAEDLAASPGVRALVLRRERDGAVGYALGGGSLRTLATTDLRVTRAGTDRLADAVRHLTAGPGDAAAELAALGVRYVAGVGAAPGRPDSRLDAAVDAQPGLVRSTAGGAVSIWRVVPPAGGAVLLSPSLAPAARGPAPRIGQLAADPPHVLSLSATGHAATRLPAGPPGRLLVVATPAEGHWRASVDGRPLPPRIAWGWAQAFAVPAGGGHLVLAHIDHGRTAALWCQLGLLLLVLVLAAPTVRDDDLPARRQAVPEPAPAMSHAPAEPAAERLPSGARAGS
ncbi:MAG: glycosyltransferase [Frankiaceae bacterium]